MKSDYPFEKNYRPEHLNDPVIEVAQINDAQCQMIDPCVWCGSYHIHGWGPEMLNVRSHRSGHCANKVVGENNYHLLWRGKKKKDRRI